MGIQQLRRPNVTQFWPPTLLSGQNGHFTWYILFRGTSILGWRLGVGCQIGVQGPQLYVKPRHFCKLDVATSRIAFLDLNLQIKELRVLCSSKLYLWHPLIPMAKSWFGRASYRYFWHLEFQNKNLYLETIQPKWYCVPQTIRTISWGSSSY